MENRCRSHRLPAFLVLLALVSAVSGCVYSAVGRRGRQLYRCSAAEARGAAVKALEAHGCAVQPSGTVGDQAAIRARTADGRAVVVDLSARPDGLVEVTIAVPGADAGLPASLHRAIATELGVR